MKIKCRECNTKININKQSVAVIVVSKKDTPYCAIYLFCNKFCMMRYKTYALNSDVKEYGLNMEVYDRRWFPKFLRKMARDFWHNVKPNP